MGGGETNTHYTEWMAQLPDQLHSVPLNQLAIPGSHDSLSFFLDKTGPISPGENKALIDAAKLLGPLVKDVVHRWSVTQSCNVTEQLHSGIRYLDIRLSRRDGFDGFYAVHGLYGMKIDPILQEIKGFIDEHPKEIVLLDFNHFYNMTEDNHRTLMSKLQEVFADKICPLLDMGSVTLETLWGNHLQIIMFYHHDFSSENLYFWPGSKIPSPWPNVTDPNKLVQILESNYECGRPADMFFVTQGVLTPDVAYIMKHLMKDLRSLSDLATRPVLSWIANKYRNGVSFQKGINVCIMDFVGASEYIPTIISLNEKHPSLSRA